MSKGNDGISSENSCITLIIHQSLTTGIFPEKLKIATLQPQGRGSKGYL